MNAAQAGRPVVAGVDGSESALEAVRWAAQEAHRRRVPLRLVSAFGWTAGHHLGDPGLGTDYLTVLRQEARDELAAAAAAAAGVAAEFAIEQEVITASRFRSSTPKRPAPSWWCWATVDSGVHGLLVGSVAIALTTSHRAGRRGPRSDAGRRAAAGGSGRGGDRRLADERGCPGVRLRGRRPARGVVMAVHTWRDYQFESTMVAVLEGDAIDADEHRLLSERLAGWSEKPDVPVNGSSPATARPPH